MVAKSKSRFLPGYEKKVKASSSAMSSSSSLASSKAASAVGSRTATRPDSRDEADLACGTTDDSLYTATVNSVAGAATVATVVVEEEANELLERYGFGSGMRMYAKSVALAAQVERDEQAKRDAEALAIQDPCVSLDSLDRSEAATAPARRDPMVLPEIPSFKAAVQHESVQHAIHDATGVNMKDATFSNAYTTDTDYEDESTYAKDVCGPADGSTNSYYQQGEAALTLLFQQAEAWAESTYHTVSCATEAEIAAAQRSKSKKSWWNSWWKPQKPEPLAGRSLSLEDIEVPQTKTTKATKSWWSWWNTEDDIATTTYEPYTSVSVDGDQTVPTSNEEAKPASQPVVQLDSVAETPLEPTNEVAVNAEPAAAEPSPVMEAINAEPPTAKPSPVMEVVNPETPTTEPSPVETVNVETPSAEPSQVVNAVNAETVVGTEQDTSTANSPADTAPVAEFVDKAANDAPAVDAEPTKGAETAMVDAVETSEANPNTPVVENKTASPPVDHVETTVEAPVGTSSSPVIVIDEPVAPVTTKWCLW